MLANKALLRNSLGVRPVRSDCSRSWGPGPTHMDLLLNLLLLPIYSLHNRLVQCDAKFRQTVRLPAVVHAVGQARDDQITLWVDPKGCAGKAGMSVRSLAKRVAGR